MKRKTFSIIDNLEILQPCTEDWDAMTPTDRGKHCQSCKKKVYDLSSMTRNETRLTLALNQGKCCMRITKREDGSIVFQESTWKTQLESSARPFISTASAIALSTIALGTSQSVFPDEVWGDTFRPEIEVTQTPIVGSQSLQIADPVIPANPSGNNQSLEEANTPQNNQGIGIQVFYGDVKLNTTVETILVYIEGTFGALVMVLAALFGAIFGILGICTKSRTLKVLAVLSLIIFLTALGLRWLVASFFGPDTIGY